LRAIFLGGLKTAVAATLVAASGGVALPYPSNPYSTIGSPAPTLYCRNAIDGGTASAGGGSYQAIDLETAGCVSGSGPSTYPNAANNLYKDWDGLYSDNGGGDSESAVERAIMLATGEVVDLKLRLEAQGTNLDASGTAGIQIWIESGKKQITWAFAPWLISAIEAGSIDIGYLTIKAADSYVLYEIPNGAYSGRYNTEGILTKGGSLPQVSHIRFWSVVDYAMVPEPGAVGLLGLGILALGLRRRLKANSASR